MPSHAEPPPRPEPPTAPTGSTTTETKAANAKPGPSSPAAYKSGSGAPARRASRRGAPRRFPCDFDGCGKVYTRAEHLQRHQLNHNPREIFECKEGTCTHAFVRADLLARHQSRHHSESFVPRHRVRSFSSKSTSDGPRVSQGTQPLVVSPTINPSHTTDDGRRHSGGVLTATQHSRMPHDATALLTPKSHAPQPLGSMADASQLVQAPAWSPPLVNNSAAPSLPPQKSFFYHGGVQALADQPDASPIIPWGYSTQDALIRDSFATWLFDSQGIYKDISVPSVPFLEGGLESTFNTNIPYDHESLTSRSQLETPPRQIENDELLSEYRRQEILRCFNAFRLKYPKLEPLVANLVVENDDDPPALDLEMMRDCLNEYWERVSSRLPIIHRPTFSCNRCSMLLLLGMVALGAASMRNRDRSGALVDYGGFADVMIWGLRWEIMTSEEATPPVSLAVAQALLLLEFHEKTYSSRRLHERAHIYHSSTLTLLRRGSPLIGRSGSESPQEQLFGNGNPNLDSRSWWIKWAETESMHRVVYTAFMMDVVHAAMFGHAADMAPHEIRLPLPCDDQLWTATNPEEMRSKDANLRMYGLKPISFLDGLKRAVHGNEVQTHSFGRMIIMCGLLSVGWHLSRREPHLKWLDLAASGSGEMRNGWRKTLLGAFDAWKRSFDTARGVFAAAAAAMSSSLSSPSSTLTTASKMDANNGPIQSAAVLYHLAHISLHVDIIDCQVYAGAKQLLGRKVSARDSANVAARMKTWAALSATRHAVLHAFKLLHQVLVERRQSASQSSGGAHFGDGSDDRLSPTSMSTYSFHSEEDPHRPWIMYYATLTIWSFVRALRSRAAAGSGAENFSSNGPRQPTQQVGRPTAPDPAASYNNAIKYLSGIARLDELTEDVAVGLSDGLSDLVDCMHSILGGAHPELLKEARVRLDACRSIA